MYLLCYKLRYIFTVGLINRRTYMHLQRHTKVQCGRVLGLMTSQGQRHGEWITGVYTIHYNEGHIVAWEEYVKPPPRWCRPSIWGLKRTWRIGQYDTIHTYAVVALYSGCIVHRIDLVAARDVHTPNSNTNKRPMADATHRYDWCHACCKALPIAIAGNPQCPNIDNIEYFLVSTQGPLTHSEALIIT